MTGRAHPGVDAYIAKLPDVAAVDLRAAARASSGPRDPEIEETIKRTVQPYFVLDGNVCALLATKDHVNLFLYDPTVSDPAGVINQGHGNADRPVDPGLSRTTRSTATRSPASSAEIVEHNRQGGWRRLGRT